MIERSNEQWIAELTGAPEAQAQALEDLRQRLQRGIFYYLSRERSDLSHLSIQELTQMAEDMAQEATLRVLNNLNSFRGDSRFTTWATKVAVRVAISDLRRARYKDFSLDGLTASDELLPSTTTSVGNTPAPDPEDSAERAEVMAKISAALDEALTERQRQALIAVALQGVPMEIVADRMNTNRNALYKLLHDARRKLRSYLEAQGLTLDYLLDLFHS